MAKQYRKNISFQAGEISPRYLGRSDTDIYSKGLLTAENVIIDKRGGVFRRGGLKHEAQSTGNNARLFTLQVSRQRYYTIFIHDLEMIILAAGANVIQGNLIVNGNFASGDLNWTTARNPNSSQILFSSGQAVLIPEQDDNELVTNGSFNQDDLGWTIREDNNSTVDFNNGACVLLPDQGGGGGVRIAGISQAMSTNSVGVTHTVTINGDFDTGDLELLIGTATEDGSYLTRTLVTSQTINFIPLATPFFITLNCVKPEIAVTLNDVSVIEVLNKYSSIRQQVTVVGSQTNNHMVIIEQQNTERLTIDIGTAQGGSDIATLETTNTSIAFQFIPNNPTYWVSVTAKGQFTTGATITFVGTAEEAQGVGIGIKMPAPWTEAQLDEIHSIEVPSGRVIYFTHPNVQTQKLIYDHETDTFVFLQNTNFVNKPPEWAGVNWPATGAHFQGRLWLAGTPNERQNIWGSVSGSVENFNTDPAQGDEAALELPLEEFGRIEWVLGTKNLLIGAENGEHIIKSDAGVITQSDFSIEQQSSFGSNNMQALQVGEKVFYLTPDGRKLRAMSYEWQEDNWLSQDLTFASEHITKGIGKHSVWSQHPNNLFAIVLQDGTLAVLTYDRTAQTVGWTHLSIPGMKILDIGTGRNNGINEILIAGQRVNGKIDIETNQSGLVHLDSYASVFDPAGTNIITGLDHLEGKQVRALVDGAVEPLKTVLGGQITTERIGVNLFAGVPYKSTIATLPPDVPQSQIRSYKKRWNKVWALMLDSKQPIINGVRPPERTPSTPMDTVEPDQTGHFKTIALGWDDFGIITIEEDLPVAMNVLGIYGEMGAETL